MMLPRYIISYSCFKLLIGIIIFNCTTCDCPFPKNEFLNGHFIYDKPEDAEESVATELYILRFKCFSGFKRKGHRSILCSNNKWSAPVPRCDGIPNVPKSIPCGIGRQNVGYDQGKVVGGQNTVEPWPWMASLFMSSNGYSDLFCGGSVINHNFILTAAHCLYNQRRKLINKNSIVVKLGLTDMKDETNLQQPKIREIYVHPRNKAGMYDFDIALLRLDQPIEYNQFVKPICLPPIELPENSDLYRTDKFAWAIGWGHNSKLARNSRDPLTSTEILKEVLLPLQPREICISTLRANRLSASYFTNRMFCAGDGKGGNDTCSGDSGGPLLQAQLDPEGFVFWTQIGITSWGFGCANENTYGYYSHVQKLRSWIDEVINEAS